MWKIFQNLSSLLVTKKNFVENLYKFAHTFVNISLLFTSGSKYSYSNNQVETFTLGSTIYSQVF